jgi:hypothetical protein
MQLQWSKWTLHEELVLRDFRAQVGDYLRHSGDQVLVVRFKPESREFLYRNRPCLGTYDMNVGLELAGERGNSFVFDRACMAEYYEDPNGCRFTGFHQEPCPVTRRFAEFQLESGVERFDQSRLVELARLALFGLRLDAGKLIVLNENGDVK